MPASKYRQCQCRTNHDYYGRVDGSLHLASQCTSEATQGCQLCDVPLCEECGLANTTDAGLVTVCHDDYAPSEQLLKAFTRLIRS